MRLLPVLLACCLAQGLSAGEAAVTAAAGSKVDDFALLDHRGEFQQLTRHHDAAFIVLFSFGTGCPIVRQNIAEVQAIAGDYLAKNVRVACLASSSADDLKAVKDEAASLQVTLPVMMDDTQLVAEALGITRTAEAIVINPKDMKLVWRGPVDDRVGYGAQKPEATRRYLREALDAALAGTPVPTDAPAVKGCLLTFAQPRATHKPDYAKEVAPIIEANCRTCHQKGGVAPWAMDSHKQVAGRGDMIREVVRTKLMPPWDADPSYGKFSNECGITVAEARTIVHWIENGAAPSVSDPLALKKPKPIPEWPLGKPDLIISIPPQNIPATGKLPYRTVEVPVDIPKDVWVRAVQIKPDHPEWLHHAFAFVGDDDLEIPEDIAADPRVQRLLERFKGQPLPPELKARLDKGPRGLTSFFASYVPGLDPAPFPEGTGKLLKKGTTLSFQFHYTTNGTAGTDKPKFGLYFAKTKKDQPERELKVTSAFQLRLDIPPLERHSPASAERKLVKDSVLFAVSPHMHYRGKSMRFTAIFPDGKEEILLSVPRYDLDWQRTYLFAEPKTVPAGTRIRVDGAFDNSPSNPDNPDPNKRVRFGDQSWDEMFIGYLVYADAPTK
ncbi:MAG: redoxin domain-containing protein [Planctomycetes bacterium]|nr:redoxin domain-containing protein [Planctomycetota bacterium]